MYFKRIDMHGFKSFAEPVSIEFTDGITCIVGPNGSGKSNISDAIRWVLGEQSPKMLRGGKMEEIIFSGTANRKSRGMAEVTLVIDNSTGILPIDYNEVAITRRMFRSGESEYSINNNRCRLRDIKELIMDTGIGVDGYSLIGQGKIADIVSNKPESRREIFEEAAGIVMYRSKKAESERKLQAADLNLERVNDIISEIESRIGGLKEDSAKAVEYLALRERYKTLEINITLKNIENIELKNEYISDDIQEAINNITEIKDEKAEIDAGVAHAREKIEVLERLSNESQGKLLASIEEINALINRSQLSEEKLSQIAKDEIRLSDEIASFVAKLSNEESNAKELLNAKKEVDDKLKLFEDELRKAVDKYTEETTTMSKTGEGIDTKKSDMFRLHNDISTKTGEISSLESLKKTLDRRKEQLLSEKETSELAGNKLKENKSKIESDIEKIKSSLEKYAAEKETVKQKYNESVINEKNLSKELEELRISIGQLSSRKKTIEEMESNYEGYNGAVKFVMKSNMQGINGVVAELISVPQGFEIAVETALGATLQNIVCENDESAQGAIKSLKENKEGRLTFLPIDSIRPPSRDNNSFKNEKGFRGFGVDCVSFDHKYKPVMEYLLGKVAVVETLDDAIRLSKSNIGGFRFVTMSGEIINAGGAITGGAYKNKTANLLERRSEITKLETQIEEVKVKNSKITNELENLRNFIENAYAEISSIDESYRAAEVELLKKENEYNSLKNSIADFNNNLNKWQNELESIEKEQAGSDKMIDELRQTIDAAKAKITETEEVLEKMLAEYDLLKAGMEEINELITKARINVSTCENEKANADALLFRVRNTISEMTLEKQKREEELVRILKEREELLFGSTGSVEDIKKKEEEKASTERYLEELTEEKAGAMRILSENTQIKDSLDEKLAALQSQKYELDIKKAKNETLLDSYKDKLWEEFEISYIQAIEFRKKEFAMSSAVKESRDIKSRIKELGEVNVGAIKEYETVEERYTFLTEQRADIISAMGSLKQIIDDMDKTIKEKFKESFDKVVANFSDSFTALFGGGYAELRLEDETNPLESGVEIIAQPPGKKLQNINLMSGGEKSMTAIAMMFAVLKTKPTPFCILDEIEAALDDTNIDRFAAYLKSFEGIQFTLVTHQKATMEHADVLYGVTMPEQGISKVISLKLGDEFEL